MPSGRSFSGLAGFVEGNLGLKACVTFAASKLDDVPVHADFRDVQGFLVGVGAGLQHTGGAFFEEVCISNDARNGIDRQAMSGFAVKAENPDFVRQRQHFQTERQGMHGKTLL